MPGDFTVTGAEDFLALSKRLKAEGNVNLRRELTKGLRAATRTLTPKTRAAALSRLPAGGGLAARIARAPQRVQVRTGAATAGVRIGVVGTGRLVDQGRVRHPVFGRPVFVTQPVPGGWFTETVQANAGDVRQELRAVLDDVKRRAVSG